MYRSCLICHGDLGENDAIPAIPVGRRFAFDPESGYIWIICPACEEWNLAPIDRRWDAVEQCEAAFAASTDRQKGSGTAIAAVGDAELVRIGSTDADGLATWRYADRLEARHRRKLAVGRRGNAVRVAVASTIVVTALIAWGAAALPYIGFAILPALVAMGVVHEKRQTATIARLSGPDGANIELRRRDIAEVWLVPGDDSWRLRLRGRLELEDMPGIHAARLILPMINWDVSAAQTLDKARQYVLTRGRTAHDVFLAASRRRGKNRKARIAKLDPHIRLALEIVANEESERQSIEFELDQLHEQWKSAHELAQIQDDLLVPDSVNKRLAELKNPRNQI